MTRRALLLATAAVAVGAVGPAHAATLVDGAPNMAKLRGKPVAMMFFHPL